MASRAGADLVALGGSQIFVTLRQGKAETPVCVDVRVQYHETIGDLKAKVAKATGVPAEHQQLFFHSKELLPALYDGRTLAELEIHTGFGVNGYDTRTPPDYFPPVFRTPAGLMQKSPITNAEYLARHPSAGADPETLVLQPGVPIKQDPADLETVREPANRELYTGMA